jgi:tape measure domain-containing protein
MPPGGQGSSGLGFGLTFSLQNNFSGPAQAIANSMNQLQGLSNNLAGTLGNRTARGLNTATHGVYDFNSGFSSALATIFSFKKILDAVELDATFQKYQLAFQTFVGSAEEAERIFEKIKQQAIANPVMSIDAMEKANTMLISQGMNAEKSMQVINDLSIVLAGVGRGEAELGRVSLAMEKIEAEGVLTGRRINQLTSAGIPLQKILIDTFGPKMRGDIKKMGITTEMLAVALHKSVEQGGQFGNVVNTLFNSISARILKLKENWTATVAAIGNALRPVTERVVDFLGDVMTGLQSLASSGIGKFLIRFGIILGVVGLALSGFAAVMFFTRKIVFGFNQVIGPAINMVTIFGKRSFVTSLQLARFNQQMVLAVKNLLTFALRAAIMVAVGWAIKKMLDTNRQGIVALGVLLSYIVFGPLGLLVSLLYLGYRAFQEFHKVMEGTQLPAQGFLGILQKIGGAIQAIIEMLETYDPQTRTSIVSQKTWNALGKLGIRDKILKIAYYIDVLYQAFIWVAGAIETVLGWFSKLADFLEPFGLTIGRVIGALLGLKIIMTVIGWVSGLQKVFYGLEMTLWTLTGRTFPMMLSGLLRILGPLLLIAEAIKIIYDTNQKLKGLDETQLQKAPVKQRMEDLSALQGTSIPVWADPKAWYNMMTGSSYGAEIQRKENETKAIQGKYQPMTAPTSGETTTEDLIKQAALKAQQQQQTQQTQASNQPIINNVYLDGSLISQSVIDTMIRNAGTSYHG